MISSILGFVLVITILVFIHELGHYSAARFFKVKVLEFSIGFGKSIFEYIDNNKTKWKLSYIPLGGYVKFFGDIGPVSNPDHTYLAKLSDEEKKETFAYQSILRRTIIVFAGPFANFLLAIFILSVFNFYYGKYYIEPVVNQVIEKSPAEKSGILSGDRIIMVDSRKIESFTDILKYVQIRPGETFNFTIERDNKPIEIEVNSEIKEIYDKRNKIAGTYGYIGIRAPEEFKEINFTVLGSVIESVYDCYDIIKTSLTGIYQIITGKRSLNEIRGTITIAEKSGESLDNGFNSLMFFIALISINIGVINLLPIPILDGGHLLFYAIEAIRGKKLDKIYEEFAYKIGFIFIIFLFVISLINDISSIIF